MRKLALVTGFILGVLSFTTLSANDADGKFSIAIYPDTQMEVFEKVPDRHAAVPTTRFRNRSQWLVDNKDKFDIRFVLHTGDMVNWEDDKEQSQYRVASNGFEPLDGVIPYAIALGNHDTHAVGPSGGSARDTTRTREYVRITTVFNTFFPVSRFPGAVTFEPKKIDNAYQTFEACETKWLVLTLELWSRKIVIDWAEKVVASHPDHNIIIGTHMYLNGNGSIAQNRDYGEQSPQYLFDNLIKKYANIKMVFSGHTGHINDRTDTGIHGNKIVSTVACIHDQKTNPVQIMEIDVKAGTLHRRFFAPFSDYTTGSEWQDYNTMITGIEFVKPVGEAATGR
jgi:3',5'-cyclic AMP phosphodiesterase CpdA